MRENNRGVREFEVRMLCAKYDERVTFVEAI
jgi:hypothetical protein